MSEGARFGKQRIIECLSRVIDAEQIGDCTGRTVAGVEPSVSATPHSIQEVSLVVAEARRLGLVVTPTGGGSKLSLGNRPRGVDLLLNLSSLDEVTEYDPANLVLTAQAGSSIQSLQSRVAAHNLVVPLDPPMPEGATLGGVLASNDHGPRRLHYGSLRDVVLGMSVVLANGDLIKCGGRTIKNVSGYDLTKLFIGSLGTLGVIVQATLRLLPAPAAQGLLLISVADLQQAKTLVGAISRSGVLVSALELLSPACVRLMDETAGGLTASHQGQYLLLVGLEGHPDAVNRGLREIPALPAGGPLGPIDVFSSAECSGPDSEAKAIWEALGDLRHHSAKDGLSAAAKISAPKSSIWEIARFAERRSLDLSVGCAYHISAGVGTAQLWLRGEPGKVADVLLSVRHSAECVEGSLVLLDGRHLLGTRLETWGSVRTDFRLIKSVKRQFDPDSILNAGRYVGGL